VSETPLTVGTAGHIDHGKTALVEALTGIDADRLAEEKARGITIVLGFAPLALPDGRILSLVDVPGHERLIRVMVSGASGIDLFLLCIAADDGVMPQTIEHARVLGALGVREGVVAVTKADLADPAAASEAAAALVPGTEVVPCSARRGTGIEEVRAALGRVAARVASRALLDRPAVLHVDRVFTVRGAGTVVTGTLWSGTVTPGDRLRLLPQNETVRVRGVQVHDVACREAAAGQRVAVNLAGLERRALAPGDVLAGADAPVSATYRLEASLALAWPLESGRRVQVHHGTRATPARARHLGGDRWLLRLERPLIAADGDRLVVRRIAPPDTLGGGLIVSAARRRASPGAPPASATTPSVNAPAGSAPLTLEALALLDRLREADHEPPSEADLGDDAVHLRELRDAGRVVRIGRAMYAHVDAAASVRARVEVIIVSEGSVTLSRLRDELSTSRRYAQAWLEHLDAVRVTRRLPGDERVLRRARGS
jgi:selenocysteine-specific elongation factor